jgi:hypothetical protein
MELPRPSCCHVLVLERRRVTSCVVTLLVRDAQPVRGSGSEWVRETQTGPACEPAANSASRWHAWDLERRTGSASVVPVRHRACTRFTLHRVLATHGLSTSQSHFKPPLHSPHIRVKAASCWGASPRAPCAYRAAHHRASAPVEGTSRSADADD